MTKKWIADRTRAFDSSGIRAVFDLASQLKDPINLSIGQPDFDVPEPVQEALIDAVRSGKNGYALTQGMPVLRDKLQAQIDSVFGDHDRKLFVSSGTSGGLVLTLLSIVNPGEEVIFFDPYFVMYPSLIKMVGGVPVSVDTYPDFNIDVARLEAAITPKTKAIILNSPANPTGVVLGRDEIRNVSLLAQERGVALISDEIYSKFCYDQPFVSPAEFNRDTIVIDGFSKSYAMTGWRVGWVHGPGELIETMTKLQQYTFVCAPQPAQWAAAAALDVDIQRFVDEYRAKRDFVYDGLSQKFEVVKPGGAFYMFPKLPWGTGSEFVAEAINKNLLVIPGKIFSCADSHFRISYAADHATLERGVHALNELASMSSPI